MWTASIFHVNTPPLLYGWKNKILFVTISVCVRNNRKEFRRQKQKRNIRKYSEEKKN